MARAVAQFALSGLAAVVLLGLVGALVLRHLGRSQAIRDARAQTWLAATAVIEPNLEPGIASRRASAIARLDSVVRTRLLRGDIVRVKLWRPDGVIVYSDEHRLIGSRYPLGDDDLASLRSGRVAASLSDLSKPENRFERAQKKLLEVYVPVSTPDGRRLLYEQYLRFSSIAASSRRIWLAFLPALLAALVLLELAQVPFAFSLARRLREGQRQREGLLQRAVDSSDAERRRIAADLHDGVVQDLAGISFGLAAAADRLPADDSQRSVLRDAAAGTRHAMRGLRSLLVDIYPPSLHSAGLEAALSDLLAPASSRAISTHLHVDPDLRLTREDESLLFRGAREAVRNAFRHADATTVSVEVRGRDGTVSLSVVDDGVGFAQPPGTTATREGHFGLAILADLVADADGRLEVASEPGRGTRVLVEVPSP